MSHNTINIIAVSCAEFFGQLPAKANVDFEFSVTPERPKESPELFDEPQGLGPTIIYVPTRRETLEISGFISSFGVRAAAYHAKVCLHMFFHLLISYLVVSIV